MVGWEADTENICYSKGVRPTKGRKLAIAEYPTNSQLVIVAMQIMHYLLVKD